MLATFMATPVEAEEPIVITYDFVTFDNGMQGLWATDTFHNTLTITKIGENEYQIVSTDTGTFEVLSGAKSPGGVGGTLVGDGTKGTITGGETVIIKGELKDDLSSHIGPIDWRGHERPIPYYEPFFVSIESKEYESWGWTYKTCNNGTWVDTAETEASYPSAAMGDITGEYVPCFPTNMDQCKKNGWETFNNPVFKNQGSCVSYVQSNDHAGKRN